MDKTSKNRQSLRLKHYDYSQQGFYFITICANKKLCLFGTIYNNEMLPNTAGIMLNKYWYDLMQRFNGICLHEFVAMPNHIHGIIEMAKNNTNLGAIIGAYKSITRQLF